MKVGQLKALIQGVPDELCVVIRLVDNECIPADNVQRVLYLEEDARDGYGVFLNEEEAEDADLIYRENALIVSPRLE